MLTRRSTLLALVGSVSWVVLPGRAQASVARAARLEELCRDSDRAALATTLDVQSQWEEIGDRRRIVSYSRVRVDETWAGATDAELIVRTLGGRVGDVGQIVHGEAFLAVGEPAVLFLSPLGNGAHAVTAMAQGHYPVRESSGERRLTRSPRAPHLVGDDAAARLLAGQRVAEARERIEQAWKHARR